MLAILIEKEGNQVLNNYQQQREQEIFKNLVLSGHPPIVAMYSLKRLGENATIDSLQSFLKDKARISKKYEHHFIPQDKHKKLCYICDSPKSDHLIQI